ncbi:hypothetical protein NB701_004481 [Pantoea ananatis]|nr:hypothetical protein [Pantoea ananatis]
MKSVRISLFILSAVFSVSVSAGNNIAVGFSPGESAQRLILNLIAGAGKTLLRIYQQARRTGADKPVAAGRGGPACRG